MPALVASFLAALAPFAAEGGGARAEIRYLERCLELLTDLLAMLPTRRFLRTLLDDQHVLEVRSALHGRGANSPARSFSKPPWAPFGGLSAFAAPFLTALVPGASRCSCVCACACFARADGHPLSAGGAQ